MCQNSCRKVRFYVWISIVRACLLFFFFSSKEKLHITLRLGDISDHSPRNPPSLLIENFDKDYWSFHASVQVDPGGDFCYSQIRLKKIIITHFVQRFYNIFNNCISNQNWNLQKVKKWNNSKSWSRYENCSDCDPCNY